MVTTTLKGDGSVVVTPSEGQTGGEGTGTSANQTYKDRSEAMSAVANESNRGTVLGGPLPGVTPNSDGTYNGRDISLAEASRLGLIDKPEDFGMKAISAGISPQEAMRQSSQKSLDDNMLAFGYGQTVDNLNNIPRAGSAGATRTPILPDSNPFPESEMMSDMGKPKIQVSKDLYEYNQRIFDAQANHIDPISGQKMVDVSTLAVYPIYKVGSELTEWLDTGMERHVYGRALLPEEVKEVGRSISDLFTGAPEFIGLGLSGMEYGVLHPWDFASNVVPAFKEAGVSLSGQVSERPWYTAGQVALLGYGFRGSIKSLPNKVKSLGSLEPASGVQSFREVLPSVDFELSSRLGDFAAARDVLSGYATDFVTAYNVPSLQSAKVAYGRQFISETSQAVKAEFMRPTLRSESLGAAVDVFKGYGKSVVNLPSYLSRLEPSSRIDDLSAARDVLSGYKSDFITEFRKPSLQSEKVTAGRRLLSELSHDARVELMRPTMRSEALASAKDVLSGYRADFITEFRKPSLQSQKVQYGREHLRTTGDLLSGYGSEFLYEFRKPSLQSEKVQAGRQLMSEMGYGIGTGARYFGDSLSQYGSDVFTAFQRPSFQSMKVGAGRHLFSELNYRPRLDILRSAVRRELSLRTMRRESYDVAKDLFRDYRSGFMESYHRTYYKPPVMLENEVYRKFGRRPLRPDGSWAETIFNFRPRVVETTEAYSFPGLGVFTKKKLEIRFVGTDVKRFQAALDKGDWQKTGISERGVMGVRFGAPKRDPGSVPKKPSIFSTGEWKDASIGYKKDMFVEKPIKASEETSISSNWLADMDKKSAKYYAGIDYLRPSNISVAPLEKLQIKTKTVYKNRVGLMEQESNEVLVNLRDLKVISEEPSFSSGYRSKNPSSFYERYMSWQKESSESKTLLKPYIISDEQRKTDNIQKGITMENVAMGIEKQSHLDEQYSTSELINIRGIDKNSYDTHRINENSLYQDNARSLSPRRATSHDKKYSRSHEPVSKLQVPVKSRTQSQPARTRAPTGYRFNRDTPRKPRKTVIPPSGSFDNSDFLRYPDKRIKTNQQQSYGNHDPLYPASLESVTFEEMSLGGGQRARHMGSRKKSQKYFSRLVSSGQPIPTLSQSRHRTSKSNWRKLNL